jgi:hypothetical protein
MNINAQKEADVIEIRKNAVLKRISQEREDSVMREFQSNITLRNGIICLLSFVAGFQIILIFFLT